MNQYSVTFWQPVFFLLMVLICAITITHWQRLWLRWHIVNNFCVNNKIVVINNSFCSIFIILFVKCCIIMQPMSKVLSFRKKSEFYLQEETELQIPTDPLTGQVDFIQFDSPLEMIQAILWKAGKDGMPLDQLCTVTSQQTQHAEPMVVLCSANVSDSVPAFDCHCFSF